ncbi:3669_t:CDS:2 [Acaulospora colombiana]|uniref:3669_t:CDS:1 n=1 Tax=Acaulospora colombiana TaxID=27376 RepID=A0ACA9KGU1_9GLOM|nr:3669_t:CDS:2 [Acaulospora colombiana]
MSRYGSQLTPSSPPPGSKFANAKKRGRREPSGVFTLFQPAQVQQFREAFSLIDQDGDGVVSEEDLRRIFASLGGQTDLSGEGVNFMEFLTMMGEHLFEFDGETELIEAFESFDEGDTGFVKGEEMRRWLSEVGERMEPEERAHSTPTSFAKPTSREQSERTFIRMATSKSTPIRFGALFGIKRRPSTNALISPTSSSPPYEPPSFSASGEQDDPFAANAPLASPVHSVSTSVTSHKLTPNHSVPTLSSDVSPRRYTDRPKRLPGIVTQTNEMFHVTNTEGSEVDSEHNAAPPRPAISGGTAASSSAAPASSTRERSPAVDEYPSPPPSNHGSPYPSGLSQNAHAFLDTDLMHVVSARSEAASSMPSTPLLIDSFPATPSTALPIRPQPQPSEEDKLPTEALPIRSSSRGFGRQRAGSTPDVWAATIPQLYSSEFDEVWNVAERDEDELKLDVPKSTWPAGSPPKFPLPAVPISPRLQSQALNKHLHQLELDLFAVTRKLTGSSHRPGTSPAVSSSADSGRMLKKSVSQSKLPRDGMLGRSASASVSATGSSPASTSGKSNDSPISSPISKSNSPPYSTPKRNRSFQMVPPIPPIPGLYGSPPVMHRAATEPTVPSVHSIGDRGKAVNNHDSKNINHKDDKEVSRRRFFARNSHNSTREAGAMITSLLEMDDALSDNSMHSGGGAIPDEEWGANLNLAIPSSLKTQNSSINILPTSPSSQKSPLDEAIGDHSFVEHPSSSSIPSTEGTRYIIPPAEIMRLEKVGFNREDGANKRGRLASPIAENPLGIIPFRTSSDWTQRSISTSRVEPEPAPLNSKSRQYRSGSLAVLTSTPNNAFISNASQYQERRPGSSSSPNISPGGHSSPARGMANGSMLSVSGRKSQPMSVTSPSSPASSVMSLPPPPRPRVRSLRSTSDIKTQANKHSSLGSQDNSSSPAISRRPSAHSDISSISTVLQKHRSIVRKPSFLDIGDEEVSPVEQAPPPNALGLGHREPAVSSRPGSGTINYSRPSTATSMRTFSSSNSRQAVPSTADRGEDSFLDMGKLSLDTIRSVPEDEDSSSHVSSIDRASPHSHMGDYMNKPSAAVTNL